MLHVSDISYGPVNGGLFDGQGAVHIEFGDGFDLSVIGVLSSLEAFIREHGMKSVHVRLFGDLYHQGSDELEALLSTLNERGYMTSALVDGKIRLPWLEKISYRVVCITESPWTGYAAAELRYVPGPEPKRPAVLPPNCSFLYITQGENTAPQDMLRFLLKNPDFRIFSRPVRQYRTKVPMVMEE